MTPTATRAWRAVLLVGLVGILLGWATDRWYLANVRRIERERVLARLMPYANTLRSAVDRRLGLLAGFGSFVSLRRSRAELEAEFAVFARGAREATPGVRALQYVDEGRIVRIEPLEGNEPALGFSLATNPRVDVRADHARSLLARRPFVTGPFALAEGGTGILMRARLPDRDGFPEVIGVVLDAPTLFRDARIPDPTSGLVLVVQDAEGQVIAGGPASAVSDPVVVPVSFEGELWSIAAMPAVGWGLAIRDWHWAFRLTVGLLVFLAMLVAYTVGARLDRLTREMEQSGSALEVAMRARGTGALSVDLATGRSAAGGATSILLGVHASRHPALVAHLLSLVPDEERGRVAQLFDDLKRGDRDEFAAEFPVVRASGSVRHLLCLAQLVRDDRGAPASFVAILTDVTERLAMEEGLRRAERMESVGKLAGGVAHDFNNLLTAISGFAELAAGHLEGISGPAADEIASDLLQVQQSARDGARLTSQLLAFSRRAPTDVGRLDVGANLANLQPVLTRLFASQLDVEVEIADGLPPARAEAALVTQIVLTLLVRARDTVPGPERIRLRAWHVPATSGRRPLDAPLGEWICLEIAEVGGRTLAATLPPRRSSPSSARGLADLTEMGGLGIAVLASGIEATGGRLVIETGPREETTARVYLPVWKAPG